MSERWLLPKSRREGYGVRGDAGRALAPLYPSREKSAAGGQTATEAGRAPPLSLSLKGTRRASGGVSRRAVRAPGSAARQVPG